MTTMIWIAQIMMAVIFLLSSGLKLLRSQEQVVEAGLAFAAELTPAQIRAIAIIEIVAAVGLIVPQATGIVPLLTPLAAIGTIVFMSAAVVLHARRDELPDAIPALIQLTLAGFVVYGRLVLLPS